MLKDKEVSKLFEDCYIEDDWIYANDGQFIVYQWAETTWHSSNRKRYLESGYIRESKSSKELVVDVRDLSLNSGVKVLRRCPICKIEIERGWQTLMRNGATFCISCSNKQRAYSIEELNEIISKIDGQRLEVTSDVIYRDETNIDYHMTYRDCLCDCGNTTNVSISSLMGGYTRSCGCIAAEFKALTGVDNPRWRGGSIRYYGESWLSQARLARGRDNDTCQRCGITKEEYGRNLDVHHKKKFRLFKYIREVNRKDIQANDLDNLVTLCCTCHKIVEKDLSTINDFRNEKGEIENG